MIVSNTKVENNQPDHIAQGCKKMGCKTMMNSKALTWLPFNSKWWLEGRGMLLREDIQRIFLA